METSDGRQHQLKRRILTLRIVALVLVILLGVIGEVLKTVYPHHYGRAVAVISALVFCVAYPISHRISRIKTELASLA
jgi:hypothetical protein